jgi:hypothetical protein
MNQKHLLRFIKKKMKVDPNARVIIRDGQELTLSEVYSLLVIYSVDNNQRQKVIACLPACLHHTDIIS